MELMKQMKSKPKLTKSTSFISWRKPIAHISARVCTRNGFCVKRTLPKPLWPHWRIYYEFAEFFFASVIMCNSQTEYEILWAEIHYETTFWIHFWALFFCFIDFCLKLRVSMIIVQNYQFIPHTFFIRMKYFFHTKKILYKKILFNTKTSKCKSCYLECPEDQI